MISLIPTIFSFVFLDTSSRTLLPPVRSPFSVHFQEMERRKGLFFVQPLPFRNAADTKARQTFSRTRYHLQKSVVFLSRSPAAASSASIKLSYGSTNFRLLFLHDAKSCAAEIQPLAATEILGHFALDRLFADYFLGGPHSSAHAKTLNLPRGLTLKDFPLALPSFSLSLLRSAIPLYPSLFFLQFFPRYEVLPFCTGRDTAKP